jgi:hypothetical protein
MKTSMMNISEARISLCTAIDRLALIERGDFSQRQSDLATKELRKAVELLGFALVGKLEVAQ